MNLPRGFKAALKRGERPRLPFDGDPPQIGEREVIAKDPLTGDATLAIEVVGVDSQRQAVHYKVVDTRSRLLRASLPSRPGKFDPEVREDRDAAVASAYTDAPRRALKGGYTRIGDQDVFIGPEPEAVDEAELAEQRERSRQAFEALKQEERVRRQTKATITRIRRIVGQADRPTEVLREMQQFLDKLEAA